MTEDGGVRASREPPVALTAHLTPEQVATLAALVDTLVPAAGYPGGGPAGVLDGLAGRVAQQAEAYRRGLDELAAAGPDARFAALSPGRRTELVARGAADGFLAAAIEDIMVAYYLTPAAWAMVGFGPSP